MCIVHLTFTLSVFKFIYVLRISWDKFGSHYGDWHYLTKFDSLTIPLVIASTLASWVCQVFYIYRCWMLSHNTIFLVSAILSFLGTLGTGIAMISTVVLATGGDTSAFAFIFIFSNVTLASGLACDVFITTFTCYYLLRAKTGIPRSDNVVFRLVKVSIESAAGPTIVALANLVLNNFSGSNTWYNLPNLTLSHIYVCSLLYTVNARRNLNKCLDVVPYPDDLLSTRQMDFIAERVEAGPQGHRVEHNIQPNEMNTNRNMGLRVDSEVIVADEGFTNMTSNCSIYSESGIDKDGRYSVDNCSQKKIMETRADV